MKSLLLAGFALLPFLAACANETADTVTSPAAVSSSSSVADRVDWPAYMARHDMRWDTPPKSWREAPHFGNAQLGSMLFCEKDGLRLDVFRAGVHDHRGNEYGWPAYSRPRFTLGHFTLKTVGKITGVSCTDKGEIRLRHFVHADDMAILTELIPDAGESACRWEWVPGEAKTTRPGSAADPTYGKAYKIKPAAPNPAGRLETKGDTKVWIQDLAAGGGYAVAWAETPQSGGRRTQVVSIAESYPEKTARDTAVKDVKTFAGVDLEKASATHRAWWHDYYRKSFVDIPDARLATLYWNSIYRYGATARKGRFIVETPGIWAQPSAWCYITVDWNVQASHWALPAANRLETDGELMEMLYRGRDNLVANVRPVEWQADSAYLSVSTQPDMNSPRDQDMRYWDYAGILPWMLHNCWWSYRYSMDDGMLREKLFPLLRRAANFHLHLLEERDGRFHLPKTGSPESLTTRDCNFDLSLLRWECETLLWSCERLKIADPLIPRWKDVLARLVDFPADAKGYRYGADAAYTDHRHGSHLLMIYPLHVVNIERNPESRELLKKSVETFCKTGGFPAMVASHGVPLAASIGDGELALSGLKKQSADLYANGMWFPSPCLESSLAAANGIQTMLLQSWGAKIRVFPAMPAAWPDAVFHDLRTEGAFLVSARRAAGRTLWVRIKSLAGEPCVVRPGLVGEPRIVSGDKSATIQSLGDGFYAITLSKGAEVVLADSDIAPVIDALPAGAPRPFGLPAKAGK
jgi:alpha-L-fucosidase 2